jgi:hypothetical protein
VPLATPAYAVLTVIRMASVVELALLFQIRDVDGAVCVRCLVTTSADTVHQEHDRCGCRYQENGGETHRSRLSSNRHSFWQDHHR